MHNEKPELTELDARLRRLKDEVADKQLSDRAGQARSGYGLAFMIATDLLGGLIGGALLGWGIDSWLGTAPFGLIAFFFIGAAAGMWNVFRTARGHEVAMGFRRPAVEPPKGPPDPDITPRDQGRRG